MQDKLVANLWQAHDDHDDGDDYDDNDADGDDDDVNKDDDDDLDDDMKVITSRLSGNVQAHRSTNHSNHHKSDASARCK